MKKTAISTILILLFLIQGIYLISFSKKQVNGTQDMILVNEVAQSVQMNWNHIEEHQLETILDYVVINQQGEVLFQTKSGISQTNERISSQFPSTLMPGGFYEQVELARYTSQTMCSAIMIVASGIILFVTLVVIFSNITNYIQEEMKHLGVLKAMGYKSNQIIGMLLLQFLSISGVTTLLGIGSSYVLFPFINTMLIAQTGIPYHVHFLFLPFIITMVTIGGTVTITVLLSASRIKKITPIMALRQGTKTHSFQKNHLPLERTNLPLSIALSLKTALLEKNRP